MFVTCVWLLSVNGTHDQWARCHADEFAILQHLCHKCLTQGHVAQRKFMVSCRIWTLDAWTEYLTPRAGSEPWTFDHAGGEECSAVSAGGAVPGGAGGGEGGGGEVWGLGQEVRGSTLILIQICIFFFFRLNNFFLSLIFIATRPACDQKTFYADELQPNASKLLNSHIPIKRIRWMQHNTKCKRWDSTLPYTSMPLWHMPARFTSTVGITWIHCATLLNYDIQTHPVDVR